MAITAKHDNQNVALQADDNSYLLVSEAYARRGENIKYLAGAGSSLIYSTKVRLWGVWVSAASSAQLAIHDGTLATGPTAIPTFSPAASTYYQFIPGMILDNGCYVTFSGSSVSYVIGYEPLG